MTVADSSANTSTTLLYPHPPKGQLYMYTLEASASTPFAGFAPDNTVIDRAAVAKLLPIMPSALLDAMFPSADTLGSQKPELILAIRTTVLPAGSSKILVVSLFDQSNTGSQTMVCPGGMVFDQTDKRGWWLDHVFVQIYLDPQCPIDQEAPTAVNQSRSVTSTVSWSWNANLGFFGGSPTGGAGYSEGYSNSATLNLEDWVNTDTSAHGVLLHRWKLTYDPRAGTSGLFDGALIPEPPSSGQSNFLIIEQVGFTVPNDRTTCDLTVNVGAVLKCTEGTKAIVVTYNDQAVGLLWSKTISVDLTS